MTFLRRVPLFVVFAVALLLAGAPARAQQAQNVPAYFAVVNADDAMLRSGPSEYHYPVAKLARNELLRVDGEAGNWARVGYPSRVPAFVPADSFQLQTGSRTGTVSRPTNLKAVNLTTGPRGSWQNVNVGGPIPAGTKLQVVEPEPTPDGRGGNFYKVVPPDNARAYVQSGALRKATQEEINQAMTAQGNAGSEGQNPGGAPTGVRPIAPRSNAPVNPPAGRNLAEPMAPTAGTPEAPTAGGEAGTGAAAPGATPGASGASPKAAEIPPSPYEKLEAAFEAVRKEPAEQAEYGELTAEIQKTIENLDPSSPQTPVIRGRLQQRLDYLKLLTDLREQKRKLAEAQGGLKENDELLRKRLAELDRVRQYTIVGRLSASTLYDGERLPLMYRVQTVGGPNPRTLAYVKPDANLGISAKLGQVVGIIGEANMDPTLRLNVITPLRIDLLQPAGTVSEPTAPAAAPATGANGGTGEPAASGAPGATGG